MNECLADKPGKPLTKRQREVADALARGASYRQISKQLHVSQSTIAAWGKRPEFTKQIEAETRRIFQTAGARYTAASLLVVKRFCRILRSETSKDADAVAAGSKLMEFFVNWNVVRPLAEVARQINSKANDDVFTDGESDEVSPLRSGLNGNVVLP